MNINQRIINKLESNLLEIESVKSLNTKSPEYDKWKRSVQQTLDKIYGEDQKFASQFKKLRFISMSLTSIPGDDKRAYNTGMNKAKNIIELVIEECREELEDKSSVKKESLDFRNIDKVFISHSSKDKEYIDLFVNLMIDMGLDRNGKSIFYSSLDGFGIPLGENIYDYLKDELNQNILVLFILSDNYYSSSACLNEMGAAWVTSKENYTILLPEFEFNKIDDAIDPMEISFKMNNKAKLNEFKNKISELFHLEILNDTIWESKRDKFIEDLNKVISNNKFSNVSTRIDVDSVKERKGDLEIYLRFVNESNQIKECHDLLIELIDNEDRLLEIEVDHEFLDDFLVFQNENRREKYMCTLDFGNFNPRKIKGIRTKSEWGNV